MRPKKIPVITGPTATGKTKLAVMLALEFGAEIISADSMQVYRGMDIGTAKPTSEEMMGVPHHMTDVADPWEKYSVARYVEEASRAAEEIISRGKLPLIVGGSGLYIDSLISGRSFAPGPKDDGLRRELSELYDRIGGEAMLDKLRLADPDGAGRLNAGDRKRIIRALEVYELTGRAISEFNRDSNLVPPRFDTVKIALFFADRKTLYRRIEKRTDDMVERGLFDEVEKLMPVFSANGNTAAQAIGYKEAAAALRGEITREEATELIKRESRRFAKRQMTRLRGDPNIKRITLDEAGGADYAFRASIDLLTDETYR